MECLPPAIRFCPASSSIVWMGASIPVSGFLDLSVEISVPWFLPVEPQMWSSLLLVWGFLHEQGLVLLWRWCCITLRANCLLIRCLSCRLSLGLLSIPLRVFLTLFVESTVAAPSYNLFAPTQERLLNERQAQITRYLGNSCLEGVFGSCSRIG